MTRFLLDSTPAAAPDNTLMWLLIALGALTVFYTVFRPAMRRNKDPLARPPGASAASSLARQRGVERDMQNLLVELSEMSRQISAQLDTRAAKLELLVREADEKIASLQSLRSLQQAGTGERAGPGAEPGSSAPAGHDGPASSRSASASDPIDPRHRPIYDLADRGLEVSQIAQQLERPRGEVELILALRANRKS